MENNQIIMNKPCTIDFETKPIHKRPDYPPEPVGVAIIEPGKRPKYLAWGHLIGNNCSKAEARKELARLYKKYSILVHNGKFDLEVGEKWLGLPLVPSKGWHDTMLLAFLHNPREIDLKLKSLADKWLNMPPNEQTELYDWILENVLGAKKKKGNLGEFIYLTPGRLAGKYAKGDVIRTKKLFELFMPRINQLNMANQYEIEKRVVIKVIEMEREGIHIDVDQLEPALVKAQQAQKRHERAIHKVLGGINLKSGPQKVEAFERLGLVEEWEYTDKGNPKTGIDSLLNVCTDKKLVRHLDKFSKYNKIIGTYMKPWLESALVNDGLFFPWFNTIRGDNDKGTYTGRFSSNFQQVPREPKDKSLPFLRNFIIPDKKTHLLYNRDFCFSDDTEVLTNEGWKLFKDLSRVEKIAQYEDGVITYAKPRAYQRLKYKGDMIYVHSMKSCDLLVSPEHQCLQLKENGVPFKIQAKDYKIGHYKQVTSGKCNNNGHYNFVVNDLLKLVVAVQADSKICVQKKCVKASFCLKKDRKIKRLKSILSALKIEYVEKPIISKPGFTSILFCIPNDVFYFLDVSSKCFLRNLVRLDIQQRQVFLEELGYWDGTYTGKSWQYINTRTEHFGLLQELCITSGVKSIIVDKNITGNRKQCKTIYMTYRDNVDTKMFKKEYKEYDGYIYCVTMPLGTVVVRRNGKAFITGQCAQEIRILSHFEDGELLQAFLDDNRLDPHEHVRVIMQAITGRDYDRSKHVKPCNFLVVYGGGAPALSRNIDIPLEEARSILQAHGDSLPGVGELKDDLRLMYRRGEMFKTAGGRWYDFEEDRDYVALNTLIQGSAADHSKRALLNIDEMVKTKFSGDARLLLTVHDEFMCSAPRKLKKRFMKYFKEAMEYDELFDLPMLSDGKIGERWGSMEKVK